MADLSRNKNGSSKQGSSSEPLILICNDDGIFAPGIKALAEVAGEFGETFVVAPDSQQSAVGHAITVTVPLRARSFEIDKDFYGQAVTGTPADCVKLAHDKLMPRYPDLVVSGINHGSNAAINILYSGTVSAATEGTILGYPSIAVSCTEFDEDADLSGSKEAARRVIKFALEKGLPPGVTLNLNAPGGPLKGIRWARQANSRYVEEFEARVDPHDRPYYWISGKMQILDEGRDIDTEVLNQGYASLTPIQYDLTAYDLLNEYNNTDL